MDTNGMNLTVAICTWNRSDLLRQTLEGMLQLRVPVDLTWELLVVDNNSTDNTREIATQFAGRLPLKYVFESKPGLSHARNCALRVAIAPYLMFTDDDVLVDSEWLAAAAETWRKYPSAQVIGGPIAPWFPVEPDPIMVRVFPYLANGFCGLDRGEIQRVLNADELVNGANFGVWVAGVDKQFNPSFGPTQGETVNGDEVEFIRQVRQAGGSVVWSPGMRVRHYVDPNRMTVDYLETYCRNVGRAAVRFHGVPAGRRFGGAPLWLWKQTVVTRAKSAVFGLLAQREKQLAALRDFAYSSGMLVEAQAQRRLVPPRN
jgi:glycosyltransferase involved in cell wall biosynthesis